MSSRKSVISFSPRAQEDIDDILTYTLDRWGEHQLVIYKNAIDDALETISLNPEIGRDANGVAGVRAYPAGKHVIFTGRRKAA